MNNHSLKTPCIGVCSTGLGDFVCRGCRRFAHEVIDWNSYSSQEKKCVSQRIEKLLSQVVQTKCHITDSECFYKKLTTFNIPFNEHRDSYCWVYDLLQATARQLDNISDFGLLIYPDYQHYSMPELKLIIDEELQILSEAHYERYFSHPVKLLAEENN